MVSPVIRKASSIVTSSVGSTVFIEGVWTSGDVICVDTDISLQPRTPVNSGSFLFAFKSRALSTSTLMYVLLPFIIIDVPSEVSERKITNRL